MLMCVSVPWSISGLKRVDRAAEMGFECCLLLNTRCGIAHGNGIDACNWAKGEGSHGEWVHEVEIFFVDEGAMVDGRGGRNTTW